MIEGMPSGWLEWGAGGASIGFGLYAARMIGVAINRVFVFFTARLDIQQEHVDAGTRELIDNLRTEVARLTAQVAANSIETERLREGLTACERKHAESETHVLRLDLLLRSLGDDRINAALDQAHGEAKGSKA